MFGLNVRQYSMWMCVHGAIGHKSVSVWVIKNGVMTRSITGYWGLDSQTTGGFLHEGTVMQNFEN